MFADMDKPYAWQPSIIDVQMLKIGQLIIIAVPGEFTTMAGRRIKDAVKMEALKHGVHNAQVSRCSRVHCYGCCACVAWYAQDCDAELK